MCFVVVVVVVSERMRRDRKAARATVLRRVCNAPHVTHLNLAAPKKVVRSCSVSSCLPFSHTRHASYFNMTRYTKLDGRKPKHLPASNNFNAVDTSSSPEPEAAAAATAPSDETTSVAGQKRKRDDAAASASAEASTSEPVTAASATVETDPVKLHKRAKLLRLKAKKAKDPTKRAELEQRARDTERMANAANGVKGKAGMGDKRAGKREEVKETNPWKAMEAGEWRCVS